MDVIKGKLAVTQTIGDQRGVIASTLITDIKRIAVDPAVPNIVQLALQGLADRAERQYDAADAAYRRSIDRIDYEAATNTKAGE